MFVKEAKLYNKLQIIVNQRSDYSILLITRKMQLSLSVIIRLKYNDILEAINGGLFITFLG